MVHSKADVQAYAYLKRLGYTVQRARQFIPEHFLAGQTAEPASAFSLVQAITSLPSRLLRFIKNLVRSAGAALSGLVRVGLGLPARLSRPLGRTALKGWTGSSYGER
jgi:tRNA-splicing endonuclease subunit Sen54